MLTVEELIESIPSSQKTFNKRNVNTNMIFEMITEVPDREVGALHLPLTSLHEAYRSPLEEAEGPVSSGRPFMCLSC